jgi:hypothetical protein
MVQEYVQGSGSCSLSMTPMHAIGQANPGGSCRPICLARGFAGRFAIVALPHLRVSDLLSW